MHKTRSIFASAKLLSAVAVITLVFSTFAAANVGSVRAQDLGTPTPDATGTGEPGQTAVSPAAPDASQGIQPMAVDGSSLYYYADGKRIPLTPSLDWVSVKFANADSNQQSGALSAAGLPVNKQAQVHKIANPQLSLVPLQKGLSLQTVLQAINAMRLQTSDFAEANPVFQAADEQLAMTGEFIATFPAGKSRAKIDALNSAHGVEIVKPILGQRNTFVMKVSPGAQSDTLAMANLYQESGLAASAAPNFVRILSSPPPAPSSRTIALSVPVPPVDDPFYPDQWALHNIQQYGSFMVSGADIRAPGAWDQTTGDPSVVIAIMDDGVDLTHEDLANNLAANGAGGYDATDGFPGGSNGDSCSPSCGNHDDPEGTNMAGLAAADSNNATGVAGICQNCAIMPVRIFYGDGTGGETTQDSWIADGIGWAYGNGASIIASGWGDSSPSTVITTAINNAKNTGRGGLGTVVVFGAGDHNTSVRYPANLANVISVGASNMCDQAKTPTFNLCNGNEDGWGSNFGGALDISAPGVWLDSTDRMGTDGDSPLLDGGILGNDNYFAYMNGTAGAAALVSGVAGLMLTVNPTLTANQVQTLMQNNTDDVNSSLYPGWDQYMGYGRLNASRAVNAAENASTSTTLKVTKTGNGGGTVTSAPLGIDCGNTCSYGFNLGDTVTLTATASPRAIFVSWSGSGGCGTGTCVVTMNGARNVSANFNLPIPDKVVLLAPDNAFQTNDNGQELDWNGAADAYVYEIEIATGQGFGTSVLVQDFTTAPGDTFYFPDPLLDGTYYWRVRGLSVNFVKGAWSSTRSIIVDTVPPAAPILTTPADNAIVHVAGNTFKWLGVTGAKYYLFEIADDSGFSVNVFDSPGTSGSTSYTPPPLVLGTHYWHVLAIDAATNESNWSLTNRINYHGPLPARPSLVSPSSGSATSTTLTLSWNAATYASTYEIQIDDVSSFTSPNYSYTGVVGTSRLVSVAAGKWYWRVRAVNSDGDPGQWSSTRNFTAS